MSQAQDFRHEAHDIIEQLPESKGFVALQVLKGLMTLSENEADEALIQVALKAKQTGEFTGIDDIARELGFEPHELRNSN